MWNIFPIWEVSGLLRATLGRYLEYFLNASPLMLWKHLIFKPNSCELK